MIVVEDIHRHGESLFLEVEMSTSGSLPLMNRGTFCRPRSKTNCGMQHRTEPRTGRLYLQSQTADSRILGHNKSRLT